MAMLPRPHMDQAFECGLQKQMVDQSSVFTTPSLHLLILLRTSSDYKQVCLLKTMPAIPLLFDDAVSHVPCLCHGSRAHAASCELWPASCPHD